MKIKKVYSLRQPISVYAAGQDGGHKGKLLMPKSLGLPVETYNIDIDLNFVENNLPSNKYLIFFKFSLKREKCEKKRLSS